MKKIYYEKVGRRYVPVAEYDSDYLDSLPKGNHLVMVYPGGSSRRYHVDPALAPMIAAGRVAEDSICSAIAKATEVKPNRKALTEQERQAWLNLIEVWGEEARSLTRPAARDVADAAVQAMMQEADKLMTYPAVKKAYEHFLTVAQLCSQEKTDTELK